MLYKKFKNISLAVGSSTLFLFLFVLNPSFAQTIKVETAVKQVVMPSASESGGGQEMTDESLPLSEQPVEEVIPSLSLKGDINPNAIPSLFFTPEALALLRDALEGLNSGMMVDVGPGSNKDPGIRELALGGIVYENKKDWTIWLNGRRITPDTIPGEIFDITVHNEYVDLKWYDAYTNRLFPIRLRANERFNLDSRLFLTGSHSDDQQL